MGIYHPGIPPWVLAFVATQNFSKVAIETGTHVGNSASLLAEQFTLVFTVERNYIYYNIAANKLKSLANVKCVNDYSPIFLSQVLAQLKPCPALFWLDAHYSGDDTYGETSPCPLMQELEVISEYVDAFDVVVCIDDARLFMMPHDLALQMEGWPRLSHILQKIEEMNLVSFIYQDVIFAFPRKYELAWFRFIEKAIMRDGSQTITTSSMASRTKLRFMKYFRWY